MKKIAVALLLVVMAFALCACSGGEDVAVQDYGWFTCVIPEGFAVSEYYPSNTLVRENENGIETAHIKFYLYNENYGSAESKVEGEEYETLEYAGITWYAVPYEFDGNPSATLYGNIGGGYFAGIGLMQIYGETEIVDTFMNSLTFADPEVLAEY